MIDASIPQIRLYRDWLSKHRGLVFDDYEALWRWSVTDLEAFWQSLWDYHDLRSLTPYSRVLGQETMPGAVWFEGARVNYAQQVFRHVEAAHAAGQAAIVSEDEQGRVRTLSWQELRRQTASLALTLREMGVVPGDRIAAYMPNAPETVIAMLACVSVGAVWSVCAPDMGVPAIVDRFRQIEPRVLIAVDGVFYAGKALDRAQVVDDLRAALPSVEQLIVLDTPYAARRPRAELTFEAAVANSGAEVDAFEPEWLAFDHPLWILYSSGTTGLPKALVHGHGGVVLNALASVKLLDIGPSYEANTFGERFHWYSSTGWVMWNSQLSGLLCGTTLCLFDGSPGGSKEAPDWGVLWRFAARHQVTYFGAGAAFYGGCMKAGLALSDAGDLGRIRALGSTGSPLPADVQTWGSAQFAAIGAPNIWWCNISGGTDICGQFAAGNRELPPAPGKLQCRQLGAAVEAWDEAGHSVIGAVGELVCTRPLPSMPIKLWGDADGSRYRDAYFDVYPGIWRHGDWLCIDPDGTCTLSGRSDATINRNGLRMGTSEIYAAVERLPEVLDSLVIELEQGDGESLLLLFVSLLPGQGLDAGMENKIAAAIRTSLSPRFIPDRMFEAPGVPRTLSGKKQELPIKRLFLGWPVEKVLNREAMANPEVLAWYEARRLDWRVLA